MGAPRGRRRRRRRRLRAGDARARPRHRAPGSRLHEHADRADPGGQGAHAAAARGRRDRARPAGQPDDRRGRRRRARSARESSACAAARPWSPTWPARRRAPSASGIPVVLPLPIDLQEELGERAEPESPGPFNAPRTRPAAADVAAAADLIERSERPLILAGRGAVLAGARGSLEALGERVGALYATSLVGNGLFAGNPRSLGVCGGFSTKRAERLVPEADLVLAFGASLNQWTTMHGRMLGDTPVVQCDRDPAAIGAHHDVRLGLAGDAAEAADALLEELARREHRSPGGWGELEPLRPRRRVRGAARRRHDRPAPARRRARPRAAARARDRLRRRPLPLVPDRLPERPRRRLLHPRPGLPVRRARARHRDRRRHRASRQAGARAVRRRRRDDDPRRARLAHRPAPAGAGRDLQ